MSIQKARHASTSIILNQTPECLGSVLCTSILCPFIILRLYFYY